MGYEHNYYFWNVHSEHHYANVAGSSAVDVLLKSLSCDVLRCTESTVRCLQQGSHSCSEWQTSLGSLVGVVSLLPSASVCGQSSNVCDVCLLFCVSFCVVCLQLHVQYCAMYTVSQKNCAKLFLSELRQISTNFDNFWQKDGKEAKIMRDALIFHLIYFVSSHIHVKRRCSKLLGYTMLKVVICNKLSNDLISTQ